MADLDLAGPVAAPRAIAASPPRGLARWQTLTLARRALLVVAAVFVAKQVFSVFAFPAFSGHDELAHFAYVRTLATERRIPVLPDLGVWRAARRAGTPLPGDFLDDDLYPWCRFALDWYCEPDHPRWGAEPPRVVTVRQEFYPSGFQYVANHPPLYYLLMSPVYLVAHGAGWGIPVQQAALRLAAIPFGLATVLLAYALARTLFPGDTFLAVTVPAAVAFQPQVSYEAAMVNNDILSIALVSLALYLCVLGVRDGFPRSISLGLGITIGLALLAKATSLMVVPVVALAVVLGLGWAAPGRPRWPGLGPLARRALWIGLPAALLVAPWYLFMFRTYGNLDAFDQVAALQWWNAPLGGFLDMLVDDRFALDRFHEAWGQYGWRLIPLAPTLLWAIGVPILVSVAGLGLYAVAAGRQWRWVGSDPVLNPRPWQVASVVVLVTAVVVAYFAVVQFGTRFALTQARYMFPVVTAAALLAMLGLRTLLPARWRPVGRGVIVAALVALNVHLFVAYVLPFHATIVAEMPWLRR